MKAADILRSAAAEMRAHRVRSGLTAFSLAIGVGAILYTLVTVTGLESRLQTAIELAGPGRIEVTQRAGYKGRGLSSGLTQEDAAAVRERWPELHMVYPIVRRNGVRVADGRFQSKDVMVTGTTEEWRRRDWVYRLRGRFLSGEDDRTGARVCVVIEPGGWVKKPFWARFFPEQDLERELKRRDLLGRRLRVEDHLFTVVGILVEPPRDRDPRWFRRWQMTKGGTLLVPVSTFRSVLARSRGGRDPGAVDEIQIDTGKEATAGLYRRRVEALLKALHRGELDFEAKDYRERISGALQNVRQFSAAVLAIGIVAVLAGGIGIMNVTLATVFSRIREIGIRRALGATRGDVVWQFVSEAMLLGLAGGLVGTVFGALGSVYGALDERRLAEISPAHALAALAVSVGTGILFSLYPAWKASRLDPVESLRYE